MLGVKLAVSTGVWSNALVAYSYKWEDCNASGAECSTILGTTNQNYTVATSDVGHTLVAVVDSYERRGLCVNGYRTDCNGRYYRCGILAAGEHCACCDHTRPRQ